MREWTERHIREIIEDMIKGLGKNTRMLFPIDPILYNGDLYSLDNGNEDAGKFAFALDYVKTDIQNDGYADYITDHFTVSIIDLLNYEHTSKLYENDNLACHGNILIPPYAQEQFYHQYSPILKDDLRGISVYQDQLVSLLRGGYTSLCLTSAEFELPTVPPFNFNDSNYTNEVISYYIPSGVEKYRQSVGPALIPIKALERTYSSIAGTDRITVFGYIDVYRRQV